MAHLGNFFCEVRLTSDPYFQISNKTKPDWNFVSYCTYIWGHTLLEWHLIQVCGIHVVWEQLLTRSSKKLLIAALDGCRANVWDRKICIATPNYSTINKFKLVLLLSTLKSYSHIMWEHNVVDFCDLVAF